MYSHRIEQAIRAASILHHEQLRKGSLPYPFITHLLSVAFILQQYTEDENTIIAGLLHDTLEDTDYTLEELSGDFGNEVATLVQTLTEPTERFGQRISWLEKKKLYAEQLKRGHKAAVMIAAADKLHNFQSMIEEYNDSHVRFVQDFGRKLDDRLEAYQTIANVINNRLQGPLLAEFNKTFQAYKNFIYAVKDFLEPQ